MSLDSDIANPLKKSGLLGRAVSFLKTPSPNIQEDHDSVNIEEFSEITKSEDNTLFIENIRALNDGIELPHELFDLLKKKLDINRGCFCVKEPEGEFFTPHGSADLDKTTLHRLKLKFDSLKSFIGDDLSPAVFTGSDIVELKPLFSMRIFDSIEKIIFLPFTHDSDLIGLLMIIESGFSEENTIIAVFNDISSEISALLSQSRFLNLNRISSFTPLPLAEITAQLENKIEFTLSRNYKLSLLFIDLTDIISYLEEKIFRC